MPNGMDQFLWFVAGVFSYRIISSILNYGHMYSFMKSLKGDIIKLLIILEEDINSAAKLKYERLRSSGLSKEDLEEKADKDKQIVNIWKEVIISRLKIQWPRYYRDLLKFNNWKEAKKDFEDQFIKK